jgi:Fe-S oxidoreductase
VSGAEAIVSACPYCKETFQAGLGERNYQVRVFDITEIIAEAM